MPRLTHLAYSCALPLVTGCHGAVPLDPASECSIPPQTCLSLAGRVPAVCPSTAVASPTRCCAGAGCRGHAATGELCRWFPCSCARRPSGLCKPAGGPGSPAPGPEPCSPVPVPRTPHGCPSEGSGGPRGRRRSFQGPRGIRAPAGGSPWRWPGPGTGPLTPYCQRLDVQDFAWRSGSPAAPRPETPASGAGPRPSLRLCSSFWDC